MKKWGMAAVAGLCAVGVLFAACGGGGDDEDKTASTTKTVTKKTGTATSKTGTPGADGTSGAGTTPGADGTTGAGTTPAADATPVPGQTVSGDASPQAVATLDPSNPFVSAAPTPSAAEIDLSNGTDEEFLGGDPGAPPEVVTELPPIPPGATIDPPTIAEPNAGGSGVQLIIDTNASEPGIQTSRTVKVGDVFRVGVVLTNVEALSTFNFLLNYDYAKAIAPSIANGSSLSRNPDINEDALGGTAAQWFCTPPAPEGDADEPGLFTGDGDPATGQAEISCYTPNVAPPSGTFVLAVVQFQAVASGTFELSFDSGQTEVFNDGFTSLGHCDSLNCQTASITVQ